MLFALAITLVSLHEPAPPCADVPLVERTVTVHVKPWADVYVDGALVARTTKRAHLSLPVGEHVITFRNPAALDEARAVVVPSSGPAPHVHVELARKPAELRVHTSPPDADVEVCTRGSPDRPMHVPLMDSPATIEVRVSRRGFSTVTRTVEVEAGRPVRVNVQLAPNDVAD
jgi:hypothetical protein